MGFDSPTSRHLQTQAARGTRAGLASHIMQHTIHLSTPLECIHTQHVWWALIPWHVGICGKCCPWQVLHQPITSCSLPDHSSPTPFLTPRNQNVSGSTHKHGLSCSQLSGWARCALCAQQHRELCFRLGEHLTEHLRYPFPSCIALPNPKPQTLPACCMPAARTGNA